jgi:hypothetical protein
MAGKTKRSLGRAPTDVVGFYGVGPVTQPTSANQAALTDSTGGTPSNTLAAIAAGGAYAQSDIVAIKNGMASLATKYNQLRSDLVSLGLIKGS